VTGYIDAHHHLWSLEEHPQTWMDPVRMAAIHRDFPAEELAEVAVPSGVVASVVVQTVNDDDETCHLLARAEAFPLVAGVVGWGDLTAPWLDDQIAAWRAGPGGQRLVGLRHLVHDEPDPEWLDRPDVRRGLTAVSEAGLAFDLLVKLPQLPSAVRVAQALPETRFVLDHLAKPPFRSGSLDAWADAVRLLAAQPNVSAKISGLITEADWESWTVADLAPAVDLALEAFGPDRLLFGSDWPVCLLAGSYGDVVHAAEQLLAQLSPSEHRKVFGDNARELYRLPDVA
jgi:L-fuconolactonase